MNEQDQIPHGYYYAPLTQGGFYQSNLTEIGQTAGQMLVAFASYQLGSMKDPAIATNTGMGMIGNLVGSIGGSVLGEAGQVVDNLPHIIKNIETALGQLNDYRSWMTSDLAD